jgi:hypothetical protein
MIDAIPRVILAAWAGALLLREVIAKSVRVRVAHGYH